MKKINIGLFIDTFFPMIDGVVMVVDNYARRLVNYANVFVFAPVVPGQKFDDSKLPYKVIRCKALDVSFVDYSLPLPDLDKKFKKELDDCHLDIVHIHSPATIGSIGVRYAKQHNIPVVATGGLSSLIVPLCKHEILRKDNLTLDGLLEIYNKNLAA